MVPAGESELGQSGSNEWLAGAPETLFKMAIALTEAGKVDQALSLVRSVGSSRQIQQIEQLVLTHRVPKYHAPMVQDAARNRAYAAAIDRAAPAARHILDLGSGSGLLAMMAARAGAARVTACEENPVLAYAARQIIAANGLADRIEVLNLHSSKLQRDEHLDGGVDLIVSETFGHDLVGEGGLSSIADAAGRLGNGGVKVIPARASIMVALATFDEPTLAQPAGEVCGFDLSLLNRHVPVQMKIDTDHPGLTLASSAAPLFHFDVAAPQPDSIASVHVRADGGPADGIVQWIRLQMDAEGIYENRPAPNCPSHWRALFFPFGRRQMLEQGRRVEIAGWHIKSGVSIWAKETW